MERIIMDNTKRKLLERALKSLRWMIMDLQTRFDATEINPGNYSQELSEAMELRDDIKTELNKGPQLSNNT